MDYFDKLFTSLWAKKEEIGVSSTCPYILQ